MSRLARIVLLVLVTPWVVSCERGAGGAATGAAHATAGSFERGPHRGRLLRDGEFALELQIFEEGVPPEFHVYLFQGNQALPPSGAEVTVQLTRLDGEQNVFHFTPQGEFLRGDGVVHEPHSFSVVVEAARNGQSHRWTFDSFEGRTTIPARTASDAGITVEVAGPATLKDTLSLTGRLVPNAERVRTVTARFPGPVRSVLRSVGDVVKAGEPLATVESNESLQTYTVTSPIAGTVVERHSNPGETAGEEPLFVVADYSSLWAEFPVFSRDLTRLHPGLPVQVTAVEGGATVPGTIARIAPADGATAGGGIQLARVVLDNRARRWSPGQFVRGDVQTGAREVPLAVKREALQSFRDFTVVFVQVGDSYEVRMLELGDGDETWVEVKEGLKPGSRYVVGNSYLIKADIEKSGASHDH